MEKLNITNAVEFSKLINLNEILEIIRLIAKSIDINEFQKQIVFENKRYAIHKFSKNDYKSGNKEIMECFTIECSDGRKMNIAIELCSFKASSDGFDEFLIYYNLVKIEYILLNGYKIVLSSKISDKKFDYNAFEKIDINKFFDGLITGSYEKIGSTNYKDITDFSLDFNTLTNKAIKFNIDTNSNVVGIYNIPNYKQCFLSSDGKQILSLNNNAIPKLEEINEFNVDLEITKINKVLEDNIPEFNQITIKFLQETIEHLKTKAVEIKKLESDAYGTIIPLYNQFMNVRNNIINALTCCSFSNRELLILAGFLVKIIEQKNMNEEYDNPITPEGKAKKIIKNLSQDELNALKNVINKK